MSLSQELIRWIKQYDKKCILYQFHHRNGKKKIMDGWIVTDVEHNLLKMVYGWGKKSVMVMNVVREYVSN
jgi:hypothetical protein